MNVPLTALDDLGVILDATRCSAEQWAAVHRARPRVLLTCRDCHVGMYAKVSPTGLRFFAHDRQVPTCPAAGESAEHRWLKARLVEAIRSAGEWAVVVEAEPTSPDTGGWRADVLATGEGGRRVAFEAQLATMTVAEGQERGARYAADGIETVWVTTKDAPWLYRLPGVKVSENGGVELHDDGRRPLVVRRGCAQLEAGGRHHWQPGGGLDLDRVVAGILSGGVVPHTVRTLSEVVQFGAGERCRFHHDAIVLAPAVDAERDRRHQRFKEARRTHELQDQARRAKYIDDLYGRQRWIVPVAVADATTLAEPGESVWLGVPPTVVEGSDASLDAALGNDSTAMGAVVWLGAARGQLRLFAVVCPVASRITPGVARSWQRRGSRVYVEEIAEARRVGRSLGWALDAVTMVNPP